MNKIYKGNQNTKHHQNDNRITLDAKHKEMMRYFKDLKKSLPIKKKRYQDLIVQMNELQQIENSSLSKDQIDQKYYIKEEIAQLKKDIKNIESNKEEYDYYLETAPLLYVYYENLDRISNENEPSPPPEKDTDNSTITDFFGGDTKTKNSKSTLSNKYTSTKMDDYIENVDNFKRTDVRDQYMKKIDPTYFSKILYEENVNMCQTCNIERTLIRSEGILLCEECREVEYIVVCSDKPSPKDTPGGDSYYAYKRSNHFAEWLSQIQAKESTEISQEIFDQILVEIKKEKISDMSKITADKMRLYLKKLKLNKYYEHIPYIIYRLNGVKPHTIGKELEEKLRLMFKEIQQPFEEVCPSSRKNFLSYSYVLYKFFELLGLDEYKNRFTLLKSRTKLHEQDKIWRGICKLTKWEYIPSI